MTEALEEAQPNVPDVYDRTADRLIQGGWVQGMNSRGPARCLAAAINEVTGRGLWDNSDDLMRPFARWLTANRWQELVAAYAENGYDPDDPHLTRHKRGEFPPASSRAMLQQWNDSSGRESVRPVAAALRECATSLRNNPPEGSEV